MAFTQRAYTPDDYSDLSAMIFELYAKDGATTIGEMTAEKIDKTIAAFAENPTLGTILLLAHKKDVVGYAILTWFWSNEFGGKVVIIDELLLKAEHRGQGIGTAFFEYLFRQNPYGAVVYHIEVGLGNVQANALYERVGFTYYKTAAMFKILA